MSPRAATPLVLELGSRARPLRLSGSHASMLAAVAEACGADPPRPASHGEPPAPLTLDGDGPWRLLGPGDRSAPARDLGELLARLEIRLDELADTLPVPPLLLHASAVELADGRAVLLAGPSGAGKSTCAVSLALTGARWIGDECLPLHLDPPAVEACRRPLALRHDVQAWLTPLFGATAPRFVDGAGKLFLESGALPRSQAALPLPLAAMVFLGEPLGRLDPGAALAHLLPCCHAFQRHGSVAFAGLAAVCRGVPALALRTAGDERMSHELRAGLESLRP